MTRHLAQLCRLHCIQPGGGKPWLPAAPMGHGRTAGLLLERPSGGPACPCLRPRRTSWVVLRSGSDAGYASQEHTFVLTVHVDHDCAFESAQLDVLERWIEVAFDFVGYFLQGRLLKFVHAMLLTRCPGCIVMLAQQ